MNFGLLITVNTYRHLEMYYGISGMGGDILYRWGNPSNYEMTGTQAIPNAVHDVRWITDDGRQERF